MAQASISAGKFRWTKGKSRKLNWSFFVNCVCRPHFHYVHRCRSFALDWSAAIRHQPFHRWTKMIQAFYQRKILLHGQVNELPATPMTQLLPQFSFRFDPTDGCILWKPYCWLPAPFFRKKKYDNCVITIGNDWLDSDCHSNSIWSHHERSFLDRFLCWPLSAIGSNLCKELTSLPLLR